MNDMPHVVTTLVIDVPVAFPQKLLRILCIEWQVRIDAGVVGKGTVSQVWRKVKSDWDAWAT